MSTAQQKLQAKEEREEHKREEKSERLREDKDESKKRSAVLSNIKKLNIEVGGDYVSGHQKKTLEIAKKVNEIIDYLNG